MHFPLFFLTVLGLVCVMHAKPFFVKPLKMNDKQICRLLDRLDSIEMNITLLMLMLWPERKV